MAFINTVKDSGTDGQLAEPLDLSEYSSFLSLLRLIMAFITTLTKLALLLGLVC